MTRIGVAIIDAYLWLLMLVAAVIYRGRPDEGASWLAARIRQIVEWGDKHGNAEIERH